MINVLFVCLGNICRSPMAEALFREEIKKAGLSNKVNVDSAGTASWHTGKPPHKGTRTILETNDVSYANMKARQINQEDFNDFDYIITMDDQNLKDVKKEYDISDHVVLKKLTDFITNPSAVNVPDPYFTGNFNETYDLVHEGVTALFKLVKQNIEKSE